MRKNAGGDRVTQQHRKYVVGQMVLANWPAEGMPKVREALADRPLGGYVFHSNDIKSPEWLRDIAEELWTLYQKQGWDPPWLAVTEEGGIVQRFRRWFNPPSAMSLGLLDNPQLSGEVGALVGQFLRASGINWNFAPSVDVLTQKYSHIIGTRSFGTDEEKVSSLAIPWLLGQQAQGVLSTVKHFPGHGMTDRDSHIERPVVNIGWDEMARHLIPYRAAFEAGTGAVMTAHIVYPRFDSLPATLSSFWLTEVLREELGFSGLVVTDALSMKGIAHYMDPIEASVQAVSAGADVIDCGGTFEQALSIFDAIYEATGRVLPETTVSEIESRIAHAKQRLAPPKDWPLWPDGEKLEAIYQKIAINMRVRNAGYARHVTKPLIEVWASGSPPTEVEEDAQEQLSGIFWLDTRTMQRWDEVFQTINAMNGSVILYTENLWKLPLLVDRIKAAIGPRLEALVAIGDPVDVELFEGMSLFIKVCGNRAMARQVLQLSLSADRI